MNAVDRQLKKIAQVFGKEEPPEVKEKTLKIFLMHLKRNVEYPRILTGSEDFRKKTRGTSQFCRRFYDEGRACAVLA